MKTIYINKRNVIFLNIIFTVKLYLNIANITDTKFPTNGFSLSIDITVCIIVLKAVIMISLTSAIVEPMSFLKVNSKISDNILIHNSTCMNASKTEIKKKKLAWHVVYIFKT